MLAALLFFSRHGKISEVYEMPQPGRTAPGFDECTHQDEQALSLDIPSASENYPYIEGNPNTRTATGLIRYGPYAYRLEGRSSLRAICTMAAPGSQLSLRCALICTEGDQCQQAGAGDIYPGAAGGGDRASTIKGPLNGTFLKLDEIPLERIGLTVASIHSLGMDTLVVQNLLAREEECDSETCCSTVGFIGIDQMYEKAASLLSSAEEHQMEVYLGIILSSTGACSSGYYLPPLSTQVLADTIDAVKKLEIRFGNSSALAGWYLPDEPDLCETRHPEALFGYYEQLVSAIRIQSVRPVLISPHMCGCAEQGLDEFIQRASNFLNASGADILVWQDSAGADGIDPDGNESFNAAEAYHRLVEELGQKHTWAVVELFNCCVNHLSVPGGGAYRPASLTRIQHQIAVSSSTDRQLVWLYQHHLATLAPIHHEEAARLEASFRAAYLDDGRLLVPIDYSWETSPSVQYPDSGFELFDGCTGDVLDIHDSAWVGVESSRENSVQLTLDLGEAAGIEWLGVHLLQDPEMGVLFPASMSIACFDDSTRREGFTTINLPEWVSSDRSEYVFSNLEPLDLECRTIQLVLSNTAWTFMSEIEIVGQTTAE